MFAFNPYSIVMWTTAATAAVMGIYVLRKKAADIAIPFMLLTAAVSIWCVGYFFEISLTDPQAKMIAFKAEYLGIPYISFLWICFIREYVRIVPGMENTQRKFGGRGFWLLLLPAVAVTAAVWTNDMHRLFLADDGSGEFGGISVLGMRRGILFYLAEAYWQLTILLSCFYVLRLSAGQDRRIHPCQTVPLLCCAIIPMIANLSVIFDSRSNRLDYTPLAMLASLGLMVYLICNRRIFDLDPLTRNLIVEKTDDAIVLLTNSGRVSDINPAAEKMFAVRRSDAVGAQFECLGNRVPPIRKEPGESYHFQYENENGVYDAAGLPLSDGSGRRMGQLLTVRDVTALHRAKQKIEYLACHDALTGLPNAVLMEKQLGGLIAQAETAGHGVNVWIVQLDSLKHINTAFGYAAGDAIIRLAVERLKPVADGGILSRFQGDRFLIALRSADHGHGTAADLAKRILSRMDTPFFHDGKEYIINASIGISRYPGDGVSAEELIAKAGIALEIAERKGRCYQFCRQEDARKARERRLLLTDLRRALEEGRFYLVYQPIMDYETGGLCSVEALVRWTHPELGTVYPGTFIPMLVEEGMIGTAGKWILDEACRQFAQWRVQGLGIPRVNVNISVRQFDSGDLVPAVLGTLKRHDLPPECLELEITETIAALGDLRVVTQLNKLSSAGVRIAIDDFGSGYSSLTYLKHLKVDTIKIDKALSVDVDNNRHSLAIIKAVKMVCDTLNMDIITEYIENRKQIDVMTGLDCHLFQGYYFSMPLEAGNVAPFVQGHERDRSLPVSG